MDLTHISRQLGQLKGNEVNKRMSIPNKSNPCTLFSGQRVSDGALVFGALERGELNRDQVQGLKNVDGTPLAHRLLLHFPAKREMITTVLPQLDLRDTDAQGNTFLHCLATSGLPGISQSLVPEIPQETLLDLLEIENKRGQKPAQLATLFGNQDFQQSIALATSSLQS